jgi:hypothetical protein
VETTAEEVKKRRFAAELICKVAARRERHLNGEAVLEKQLAISRVLAYLFRSKEEQSQQLLSVLQFAVKRVLPPDQEDLLADLRELETQHAVMTLAYFIRSFDRLTPLLHAAGLIPAKLFAG